MNTNTLEQSQDTTAIETIREQLKAKKRGQAVRELATPTASSMDERHRRQQSQS